MKKLFVFALMAALLGGASVRADVTSAAKTIPTSIGSTVDIPINLTASGAVAGINGEMNFDSAVFSNPTIYAGAGAGDFTVLGNEKESGVFRFVIYSNPTNTLSIWNTVAYIRVHIANDTSLHGQQKTITFNDAWSAASDANGASYSVASASGGLGEDVLFNSITFNIAETLAEDWMLYQ